MKKTQKTKIWGFITVGEGEVHRYLKNALERLSELTDGIVIACNASDKDTRSYLAKIKKAKVYDFSERERYEWGRKQNIIKQKLFYLMERESAEDAFWVVCIDSDEVLDKRLTREKLEELTTRDEIAYTFYCVQLWDSEKQMRVDGGWGNFRNVRFYKYIKNADHSFQNSPLHCGLAPIYAYKWAADAEYLFKHYGYMKPEDRKKKVQRYNKYDPNGRYFSKEWYNSILGKPTIKPFDEDKLGEKLKYKPKKPLKDKYILKEMKQKIYFIKNKYGKVFSVSESQIGDHKRKGIEIIGERDITEIGKFVDVKELPKEEDKKEDKKENLGKISYTCPICGFEAKTKAGLSAHKRKHK